jgi:hypothetical protein
MTSNFDHYATTRELISRLGSAGHVADAAALKMAIENGATGTEIFMALRFQLAKIIKRVPLTEDSRTLASTLLSELENALE